MHTHSTHCMRITLKTRFQFSHWIKMFCFQRLSQYSNLFTFSGLKWNKLFLDFALLYSPRNDPHFSSCRPRNDPQGIRVWWLNMGLWIAFLFFVEMLQPCHFFLFLRSFKRKETSCRVTSYCLVPVSLQSRSSRPLTHVVWCNVSNRVVFSSSSVLCFTKRYFGKWW